MDIFEFIKNYRNHPVLFVGAGVSLRYLKDSYTWDGLLKHISTNINNNQEYYLDIKSSCSTERGYDYPKIASRLEYDFNELLKNDRNGRFKQVNDLFYKNMEDNICISRFKIYISQLLQSIEYKDNIQDELDELKKARKNIASIITTNYDQLIEKLFDFQPLVGNDILLSNPYGSVYKIHGCVKYPQKVIITEDDYTKFGEKYELIRAQLLSLFIHNPIIFLGYGIGDENIKSLLKTIFTYVDTNSETAEKIRNNFLLVEYEKNNTSLNVTEHDIDLEGLATIRINKIKTDNFKKIYKALSQLLLPVSAMDVRKVQNIVKEIYAGGNIKVNITEDLDSISNGDKIIAIGSKKTIQYYFQTISEIMTNYFKIIDESNSQLLELINKQKIQKNQYFPVFGFSQICDSIEKIEELKRQQIEKVHSAVNNIPESSKIQHCNIENIINDTNITTSNKNNTIIWLIYNQQLQLSDAENYLRNYYDISLDKSDTSYRKLLCTFDLKKYGNTNVPNL